MKKIILFIIGIVFVGIVGVLAANTISASSITYKNTTVEDAIDDLYTNATETVTNLQNQNSVLNTTNSNLLEQNTELQAQLNNVPAIAGLKFCRKTAGTLYAIGSEYSCNLGDNVQRTFYLLAINNNEAKLIMDRNITSDTTSITWMDAMVYFDTGAGATYKTNWTNILDVDLPIVQDIANAVGNSSWKMATKGHQDNFCLGSKEKDYSTEPYCDSAKSAAYSWLFNHLRYCVNYGCSTIDTISISTNTDYVVGYWTRDIVALNSTDSHRAWCVDRDGMLRNTMLSGGTNRGVRPVITVLKSNLYSE